MSLKEWWLVLEGQTRDTEGDNLTCTIFPAHMYQRPLIRRWPLPIAEGQVRRAGLQRGHGYGMVFVQ